MRACRCLAHGGCSGGQPWTGAAEGRAWHRHGDNKQWEVGTAHWRPLRCRCVQPPQRPPATASTAKTPQNRKKSPQNAAKTPPDATAWEPQRPRRRRCRRVLRRLSGGCAAPVRLQPAAVHSPRFSLLTASASDDMKDREDPQICRGTGRQEHQPHTSGEGAARGGPGRPGAATRPFFRGTGARTDGRRATGAGAAFRDRPDSRTAENTRDRNMGTNSTSMISEGGFHLEVVGNCRRLSRALCVEVHTACRSLSTFYRSHGRNLSMRCVCDCVAVCRPPDAAPPRTCALSLFCSLLCVCVFSRVSCACMCACVCFMCRITHCSGCATTSQRLTSAGL